MKCTRKSVIKLGDQLSDAVIRYNKKDNYYVDYYDADVRKQNDFATTSYINPHAFSYMKSMGKFLLSNIRKSFNF